MRSAAANLGITLECHSVMILEDVSKDEKKYFVSCFCDNDETVIESETKNSPTGSAVTAL